MSKDISHQPPTSSQFRKNYKDRLFKTITFPVDSDKVEINIKAVTDEQIKSNTFYQKQISIPIEDLPTTDSNKFRVRVKLSSAHDGVLESNWVRNKNIEKSKAKNINQYRIRGITENSTESDWVYSNIRDKDNHAVVFELLHDILDIMIGINDDEVDALLTLTVDDFIDFMFENNKAKWSRLFDHEEDISWATKEVSSLAVRALKEKIVEDISLSSHESSTLAKVYDVFDQYDSEQTDFFISFLTVLIEDQFEDIVKEMRKEVLLQNDEGLILLIEEIFNFETKGEFLNEFFDINPEDDFIVEINDVIELISEPAVFEEVAYKSSEDLYNLFTFVFKELYIPLSYSDDYYSLVKTDLETEEYELDINGSVVQYIITKDKIEELSLLANDVLHLLLDENGTPLTDVQVDFVDKIFFSKLEKKLAIWIDYSPVSLIEFIAELAENISFQTTHNRLNQNYNFKIRNKEEYIKYNKVIKNLFNEEKIIGNQMSIDLKEKKFSKVNLEEFVLKFIEKIIYLEKNPITYFNFSKEVTLESLSELRQRKKNNLFKYFEKVFLSEEFILNSLMPHQGSLEDVRTNIQFKYHNIFKILKTDEYDFSKTDNLESTFMPYLRDYFIMDGRDEVMYMVGEFDDISPIGKFVLRRDTLAGSKTI